MTTNFERVRAMLDYLAKQPGFPSDADIAQQALRLASDYRGLTNTVAAAVDYTTAAAQAAYVYMYVPANADLIYRTLIGADEAAGNVAVRSCISVVAIGGGPGTELIGLFKYLDRLGHAPRSIGMTVMDHYPDWQAVWDATRSTQPAGVTATMTFQNFGWTSNATIDTRAVAAADILFLSYTLSEVWRYDTDGMVTSRLDTILDGLKPGAIVIYSDNGGPTFNDHADRTILARQDLVLKNRSDFDHMLIGSDEETRDVANYKVRFGNRNPKITGVATCLALVKL